MRTLLLLSLLLITVPPVQSNAGDGAPVTVVSAKWTKTRQQKVEKPDARSTTPAAAMTAADKNFARNRRVNDPAGVRDPNADTIDSRSAALDKAVRDARAPSIEVEGYAYRVKVQNAAPKNIEVIFWEYQFEETANPSNLTRRQFLCGVQIKGGKEKELQAFGGSGPAGAISAESLAHNASNPFAERVVVNRVEYADGTIWQRKDWNYAEVRASIQRAVSTPWGAEMCRAL